MAQVKVLIEIRMGDFMSDKLAAYEVSVEVPTASTLSGKVTPEELVKLADVAEARATQAVEEITAQLTTATAAFHRAQARSERDVEGPVV
jgi:hypothetical protein